MSTSLSTLEAFGMSARAVIQQLDDTFPPVTPNPTDSLSTIMYRSGQRSVIEWIKLNMEN